MNLKRKAICLAVILLICVSVICHIASSFNRGNCKGVLKEGYITVKISGAVKERGTYKFNKGISIYECIYKAGGTNKNADLSATKLTQKIYNDYHLHIPKRNKGDMTASREIEFSSDGIYMKCNINKADEIFLAGLSGIGDKTASKIAAYRQTYGQFKTKEDILNVKGIGIKTYNKIKDYITVGGEH